MNLRELGERTSGGERKKAGGGRGEERVAAREEKERKREKIGPGRAREERACRARVT